MVVSPFPGARRGEALRPSTAAERGEGVIKPAPRSDKKGEELLGLPPLPASDLLLDNILEEEAGGEKSDLLTVLFSGPLAWRDWNGQLHPIELLEFDLERELLVQSFQEAGCNVKLRFDFATTERLRTAVTLGCRALHYSGHGHKQGLTMEDGFGGLQFVSLATLRSLCAAGEHKLEFVFVSACFSRLAGQAFLDAGVPHVVCVNVDAQVMDSAALAFQKAFYLALFVGNSVMNAFEIGKQAVAASPNVPNSHSEGEKFLLLPEGQEHNVSIFTGTPLRGPAHRHAAWLHDSTWPTRLYHLPNPPEDFLGRSSDMFRTVTSILTRRLVTLVGLRGVGKSALAAAACNYIALRNYLPDGIVMIRLEGKRTLEELVKVCKREVKRQLPSIAGDDEASTSSSGSGVMGGGNGGGSGSFEDWLERDQEWLFSRLRHLKCLLVLDHIEELQAQDNLDLKVFLRQLFDQTKSVKVLVTSSRSVDLHTLPGTGVGETLVSVGPLSFRNTVRNHVVKGRGSAFDVLIALDNFTM